MSWNADLRRLWACPWIERGALLEAAAWIGVLRVAVSWIPFRDLARFLGLQQGHAGASVRDALSAPPEETSRIVWALDVVAARLPGTSTCLVRALAGAALLRRRGLPARVVLGVAKDLAAPADIAAHAWLYCGDRILTGASEHGRFTPIAVFEVQGHDRGPAR